MKEQFRKSLIPFVPESSLDLVVEFIFHYKVNLTITKSRSSLHGDYYPPDNGEGHKISVNYNLNKYAFLIVLIHEIGHLVVHLKHKNSVRPHGSEWKKEFATLMRPFMEATIFPNELKSALSRFLVNPGASLESDANLVIALDKYNKSKSDYIFIDQVEDGSIFQTSNGNTYKKIEKLRKRIRALDIKSKQVFLFSPTVKVKILS